MECDGTNDSSFSDLLEKEKKGDGDRMGIEWSKVGLH